MCFGPAPAKQRDLSMGLSQFLCVSPVCMLNLLRNTKLRSWSGATAQLRSITKSPAAVMADLGQDEETDKEDKDDEKF